MTGVVVVAIVVLLKVIRTSSEGRVQSAESENSKLCLLHSAL